MQRVQMPEHGTTFRERLTVPVASFALGCLKLLMNALLTKVSGYVRKGPRVPVIPVQVVILKRFENTTQTRGIFLPLFINTFILLRDVTFFQHFCCIFRNFPPGFFKNRSEKRKKQVKNRSIRIVCFFL
jgi:hypothetical protein